MCACGVRSELMDYQERLRDKKFHARNKAKHGFYATVRETDREPQKAITVAEEN